MTDTQKCGCGGPIGRGGCLKYLGSDDHTSDAMHEDFMRHGGMGFHTAVDSYTAMMSAHLQANGFSYEESERMVEAPAFRRILGKEE